MSSNSSENVCALGDGFKAVLLDVAGTITSIDFVKVSTSGKKLDFTKQKRPWLAAGKNPSHIVLSARIPGVQFWRNSSHLFPLLLFSVNTKFF